MPTPIQPDKLARAAGFDPYDFTDAVKGGADEYAGVPIGSWRQNGGEYLNVPDDYAAQLGFETGRSQSPEVDLEAEAEAIRENGLASHQPRQSTTHAVAKAAPAVSANAGAGYTLGEFAKTVREQPQVMGDVVDGAALLGSAGLAYATAEEGDVAEAAVATVGIFAAFKGLRYLCEQGNRQTDMAERQQRHQIQQNNQKQMESSPQRRLTQNTGSPIQVNGT